MAGLPLRVEDGRPLPLLVGRIGPPPLDPLYESTNELSGADALMVAPPTVCAPPPGREGLARGGSGTYLGISGRVVTVLFVTPKSVSTFSPLANFR